jgi:hypothetical protein
MFIEKFGSHTRKTFNKFTTTGSYTWNIIHNTESTAALSLKPERWGSLLVQGEKYQEEKACENRKNKIILTIITSPFHKKILPMLQ